MQLKPASTFAASRNPIVDSDGAANRWFIKVLQDWDTKLANGLNRIGQITQDIPLVTKIEGRGQIGAILGNISDSGVIDAAGMASATSAAQGAVKLPAGASTNVLGDASLQPVSAFDPSGAAASAQTAAQAHADAVAATAQANAESFASNASNLTSGVLDPARLSGFTGTITTAKLTTGGANGSMTFQNGLLISQVAAS